MKKIGEKIRSTSLTEKMAQARIRLDEQRERLEYMAEKLQERDRTIFQKCISSQLKKDMKRAKLYATECVEIKKMAKIVLTSQLALERVILRLKTIEEFGEVLIQIVPVIDIVKETKDSIRGIIPEVATELEQINSLLRDMSLETGEIEDQTTPVEAVSMEAEEVLKESSIIAEEIMKEKFPEPKIRENEKEPKLIVASEGGNEDFENTLLNYVKLHKGKISISKCAKDLNISTNMVKNMVERLVERGKIEVE